jgi:hypothetical protein
LVVIALTAALAAAGCSATGADVDSTTTTIDTTTTSPPGAEAIADGTWFAMVTVGEDETGEMTLGVDLADMLSGEEARQAAIEDGVIEDGEDLPNDFYIDNDDQILELLHVTEDAQFALISADDIGQKVLVDSEVLADVYEGTYTGDPLYTAAGAPFPMEVTVGDGVVTGAEQVYLP